MTSATRPLLEGRNVSRYFGGLAAVDHVDFAIYPGEIVGLVGPNGSGKTTLFDCLSRLQPLDSGQIWFKGRDVTRSRPYQMARMGLARTFQVMRVYRKMTVLENMLVSRQWRNESILRMFRSSPADIAHRAHARLDFLQLAHLADEKAGHLSGGQRRLLEIGMALMSEPDIVLLDEATSGINPTLVEMIKDRLRALNAQGTTFLLIEHNINFIADLCSRVYVLHQGAKLAEGTPMEIMENEAVIEAYFGA